MKHVVPSSNLSDPLRQLRKLSIRKMQFRVTKINFDFEDDNFELSPIEQQEVIEETLSTTWEAADEEDLVEEITNAMGWCIKSIDYRYLPQFHQSI
tara:strand:- start:56 stop:343 length:288 start_codon:yes stop_codon:yes gene_type:complete